MTVFNRIFGRRTRKNKSSSKANKYNVFPPEYYNNLLKNQKIVGEMIYNAELAAQNKQYTKSLKKSHSKSPSPTGSKSLSPTGRSRSRRSASRHSPYSSARRRGGNKPRKRRYTRRRRN